MWRRILKLMNAIDIVNKYYSILSEKQGEGLEAIAADDIVFDDPMTKARGVAEFVHYTKMWAQNKIIFHMLKQFADGNDICSLYTMEIPNPGGMLRIDVADFIQVREGKIAKEKVYFDPQELEKAFAQKEQ